MHFDLLGIFVAGLLTFASPCVLPLVPVYLSVLAEASVDDLKGGMRAMHALRAALAFSLGLAVVFVVLGLAASAVGSALVAHRTLLLQLGGLVVMLFGLKALGLLRVPWLERDVRPLLGRVGEGSSLVSALVLGAAFALGWTPCVGPVLGSVLTYAASQRAGLVAGAVDLGVFAAGVTLPLIVIAAFAPLALHWHSRLLPHLRKLEVATGVLLVAVGLLLNTDHLDWVVPSAAAGIDTTLAAPSATQPDAQFGEGGAQTSVAARSGGCGLSYGHPATPPSAADELRPAPDPLAASTGLRLVEFISRTCPVCQRMVPVLQAAERDCAGAGIAIIRVDVGSDPGLAAARRFGVRGVPTFVFLDPAGAEVARLVGEQPLEALEQSMAVLTGGRCDGFRAFPAGATQAQP